MGRKQLGWVCPICETSYSSEADRNACWLSHTRKPVTGRINLVWR